MSDDFQIEPKLSEAEWCARFAAHIMKSALIYAGTRDELLEYAEMAAKQYLPDRREYTDPEEAASTDVGYWEDG